MQKSDISVSDLCMSQHCPHYAEIFWLCADHSGLRQMRKDLKWQTAIAEQQGRFFAMGVGTAASFTVHISYVKDSQILSVEALADIVWCYPALGVRHLPKHDCMKPAISFSRSTVDHGSMCITHQLYQRQPDPFHGGYG